MKLPVHGQMMTISDVARIFGVTYTSVYIYRTTHRGADGLPMPLEAVYDRYAAVKRGDIPRNPGRSPKRHRVAGKRRTANETAAALGISTKLLYAYMSYHKCNMDEAFERIQARHLRRAERQILDILRGK